MPDTNNKKQRTDLQSLYPVAKTYKEIESDRQRSELRRIARMPKYPRLRYVAKIFFVVAVAFVFVSIIPGLVMANVIAGVFFSFFLLIIWASLVWWLFD